MAHTIRNPILPGFHPDPSILRVGDDFFLATSTFEWFPGVEIHHSRDLVHWRLLTRPLDSTRLLDMRGNPCSGGVWAPCLTHDGELFHLVYSDVKQLLGGPKDLRNYLVTAKDIQGPWSDPILLNGSGFDPSLFHDNDGSKWLVNMLWDHRPGKNHFAGIVLQRYDTERKCLIGPVRNIFAGTALGVTEGPHLYRRGDWYYLLVAEGGTGWNHAVTVARSRKLEGPYEADPLGPMLTSRDKPHVALQKAGHGDLVDTPGGEWYLAHLCSRPLKPSGRCILGRETALQKVQWNADGWPRLEGGGNDPALSVPAPHLPAHPFEAVPARIGFEGPLLHPCFQSLRVPIDPSWASLGEREGYLRMRGRESTRSRNLQSLVARRVEAFKCRFQTCLEFEPWDFQRMAGLIAYYNADNHYYLRVTHDRALGKCVGVMACDNGAESGPLGGEIKVEGWPRIHLRADFDGAVLCFAVSPDSSHWITAGPTLDASTLSDDYVAGWGFTGAFCGMCVQDLSGGFAPADFAYFEYREIF